MHDGDTNIMNGHPLRVLRTQLDLSQKDFAAKVGVSEVTISRAENGHRLSPKVRHQLCDRLGMTSEGLGLLGRKREVIQPASALPPAQEQEYSSSSQTILSLAVPMQPQSSPNVHVKYASPMNTIVEQPKDTSSHVEKQQEQAWLTLGTNYLGQLFNHGWSDHDILDSVKIVLQGIQGMPSITRQNLLVSSVSTIARNLPIFTGKPVLEEEKMRVLLLVGNYFSRPTMLNFLRLDKHNLPWFNRLIHFYIPLFGHTFIRGYTA